MRPSPPPSRKKGEAQRGVWDGSLTRTKQRNAIGCPFPWARGSGPLSPPQCSATVDSASTNDSSTTVLCG